MSTQKGWGCPRCGRCYAPVVLQCGACQPQPAAVPWFEMPAPLRKVLEQLREEHRKKMQEQQLRRERQAPSRLDPSGPPSNRSWQFDVLD